MEDDSCKHSQNGFKCKEPEDRDSRAVRIQKQSSKHQKKTWDSAASQENGMGETFHTVQQLDKRTGGNKGIKGVSPR